MSVPARVAADASAAQDAGRSVAILDSHPEAVHGCQLASDRDFLPVRAAPEQLVLLARRDARKQRQVLQPPDASQKAVYLLVPALQALKVE
jgi:hypothetical protein